MSLETANPVNIENCLKFCPKGIIGDQERIAKFCIEHSCPGPIVQERISDITESTETDENTARTYVVHCGADLRTRMTAGPRPEDYVPSGVQLDDDETLLVVEYSQEELRDKPRSFKEW